MYESDCNMVELKFIRNVLIGCNVSKSLVTMDPYNSLIADSYRYIVGSRGTFVLSIDY